MPLNLGLVSLRAFSHHNIFTTRLPLYTQRACFAGEGYKPLRSLLFKDKPPPPPSNEKRSNLFNFLNDRSQARRAGSTDGNIQLSTPIWDSIGNPRIQKLLWDGKTNASNESIQKFRKEHDISISKGPTGIRSDLDDDVILNFDDVEWPSFLNDSLKLQKFKEPTPIQSQAWPILLKGNNLVGVSETGSGKTLAYALPAIWHVSNQARSPISGPKVLVIAPVRELAAQINEQFVKYCGKSSVKPILLCGGSNRQNQTYQLYHQRPQIAVCTPGRLSDLVNTGALSLQNVSFVVLDEADRLLDMGFEPAIRAILEQVRPDRQITLFTATWPKEVRALASEFMHNNFYRLTVGNDVSPAKNVTQHIELCHEHEKFDLLAAVLKMKKDEDPKGFKALVFCNKKSSSEGVVSFLREMNFKAEFFHGGLTQEARTYALNNFKAGRTQVLIASDAAARGFDVPGISLVVNHDFPMDIETYVHRIGRTGRAGAKGDSISFVTSEDSGKFSSIVKILEVSNQPVPPELLSYRRR